MSRFATAAVLDARFEDARDRYLTARAGVVRLTTPGRSSCFTKAAAQKPWGGECRCGQAAVGRVL